jgi:hypothetical protein
MQSDLDAGDTDIQCLCCLANREFFHIAQKENFAIEIRKLLNRQVNQIPDLFPLRGLRRYFALVTQEGR